MINNISLYQTNLEKELGEVETELKTIARINPDNPQDWELLPEQTETLNPDPNEAADVFEEHEGNTAILKQLEIRFNEIKDALKRIKDNTFGICEIGGEMIEEDRLIANPAARTCKQHMNLGE
ncbi:MAG: TraR/DksA C4-type zinc finger protein [Candidatus Paceibacterota bacterium]|jgi:DnaK suppressor protein